MNDKVLSKELGFLKGYKVNKRQKMNGQRMIDGSPMMAGQQTSLSPESISDSLSYNELSDSPIMSNYGKLDREEKKNGDYTFDKCTGVMIDGRMVHECCE